ncbi:Sensor kinase CckA [Palleronia abyssalis]|uniref:histidine kinase n=1 Tax=Palleronia abyssalis TaxID=1501240 RepID=A0A2R8BR90_9RHOB|nr:Sensor kinase CckA [Palleronia abyssalis]
MSDVAARYVPVACFLLLAALVLSGVAAVIGLPVIALTVAVAAAAAGAVSVLLIAIGGPKRMKRRGWLSALRAIHANDRHPVYVTDARGARLWSNAAGNFYDELARDLADPSEEVAKLRGRALAEGSAERWIGCHPRRRISATRIAGGDLLWRLDTGIAEGPASEKGVAFEHLPIPLLELDRNGTVVRGNRVGRDLLAIQPGESVVFSDLVEGLGRSVPQWIEEAFGGISIQRPEVGRASRRQPDVFLQITLNSLDNGSEDHIMAVLHDATELKTLEAQFVQSQKMQAIGQLAGGVAHDFNNLLTAIRGHCDLLLLRHDPGDPNFSDLEQINQNANRAASLVGQLLAFSRKQNLRPEMVDLRGILSDLTHLLNRLVGEKVALSFSHAENLPRVRADRRQLEQVIMNLVVNARDAMPEGGTIDLKTELRVLRQPWTRDRVTVPAGEYAVISVSDTGSGIAPEVLEKIFEPFFTTKRLGEGTGLGLSTAYGIVKQTGGYIFADSKVGQGTTFVLFFPITQSGHAVEDPVAPEEPKKTAAAAGEVILLAEDEAPVRAFAARALRLNGYEVLEAENAEDALAIAQDLTVKIDLFVSDVIMPGRDGPSWVQDANRIRSGTPVIFMSGYAEESFAETQARIPKSAFLQKPFSLADLTAAVSEQLRA